MVDIADELPFQAESPLSSPRWAMYRGEGKCEADRDGRRCGVPLAKAHAAAFAWRFMASHPIFVVFMVLPMTFINFHVFLMSGTLLWLPRVGQVGLREPRRRDGGQ